MKILFGGIVADGSGPVGDYVVTRNRYGRYIRHKQTILPARSAYWVPIWTARGEIQTLWQALDIVQYKAWTAAAKEHPRADEWGRKMILPAYNYFLSVNLNRYFCGTAYTSDVPAYVATSYFTEAIFTFNAVEEKLLVEYEPGLPSNVMFKLWTCKPLSSGRNVVGNAWRLLGTYLPDAGNMKDISTAYFSRFGLWPVTPQHVFCRISQVHVYSGDESLYMQALASYI
jgi:hypothetical protein